MLILESDKENKINFEVDIKSTERINGPLKARLVVCSNKMSYIFEGVYSTDNIEFIIPALPHDLREGIYKSKLEIIFRSTNFASLETLNLIVFWFSITNWQSSASTQRPAALAAPPPTNDRENRTIFVFFIGLISKNLTKKL